MYDLIRSLDECQPGTQFYKDFLLTSKASRKAQFLTRCLERIDFVARKNSIGQVVPDSWREDSEEAAQKIRENLSECDVIVNADQTFLKLYMERDTVLAPVGTKRVGGKVKVADKKAGITVMFVVEMFSNKILPAFLVFNGTKKTESKRPERTLDHK